MPSERARAVRTTRDPANISRTLTSQKPIHLPHLHILICLLSSHLLISNYQIFQGQWNNLSLSSAHH